MNKADSVTKDLLRGVGAFMVLLIFAIYCAILMGRKHNVENFDEYIQEQETKRAIKYINHVVGKARLSKNAQDLQAVRRLLTHKEYNMRYTVFMNLIGVYGHNDQIDALLLDCLEREPNPALKAKCYTMLNLARENSSRPKSVTGYVIQENH